MWQDQWIGGPDIGLLERVEENGVAGEGQGMRLRL